MTMIEKVARAIAKSQGMDPNDWLAWQDMAVAAIGASLEEKMQMEKMEMLARMWVMCDPNRDQEGLDRPLPNDYSEELRGKPRWHWFLPRAEASEKFFEQHGYRLVKIDAALSEGE